MKLAVNYSGAIADLLRRGHVDFDLFKTPAWPDLIATAQTLRPVNVHLPLLVGYGIGGARDGETGQPPDWSKFEALLAGTGTPLVNVHMVAPPSAYPGLPLDTDDPTHIDLITERLIADVAAVVRRFGAERVIAENNPPNADECLRPAYQPEVISNVVRESGCGLLLDLAHVRLAARTLGQDECQYAEALPVERIREIHVTGIQRAEGRWLDRMRQQGVMPAEMQRLAGRLIDHLPMTDEDWSLCEWAMAQIGGGRWNRPWIVTFEYGGVGPKWEAVTDADTLRAQVPRLHRMVTSI
jgi:hypothetical protein